MPVNRNALVRYKTIDACLQNRYRKWTLEDLIEACSDALYEYEGIRKGVSRRTVQMDIQLMRSEKLGYNAPIVVLEKKFYRYEDPKYSITNIPLTRQDLSTLHEVVGILQQFKGFRHFEEVDGMVSRLQHKIYTGGAQRKAVIDFEKNEHLTGLKHLEPLFQAVAQQQALQVKYQSFRAKIASENVFHPHLLKEYRNRWFVLGLIDQSEAPVLLALDRIQSLAPQPQVPYRFDPTLEASYFDDLVGVTKNLGQGPQRVLFWVDATNAPYVRTKPFHPSQVLEETRTDGCVFSIQVVLNLELERELLGFAEALEVLAPRQLRQRLAKRLQWAQARYQQNNQ
ncbi:MAG: WYL domain-containing protein [Saprospiraceae bacterium]|nr:WYL domain-containing protein [Saprospiraceae bacterium]